MSKQGTKKDTSSAGRKKTAAGRSGNSRTKQTVRSSGRQSAARTKEINDRKAFLKKEAAFVVVTFISLFLFLSNFGILGKAGGFVSGIQKGCFGYGAFLFPLMAVLIVYMFLQEERGPLFWLKIVSVLILFICLCAMIHLAVGDRQSCSISEFFRLAKEGRLYKEAAGGAAGGFIAVRLFDSIAGTGAWLLLLSLSVLCIVMITEKSIINAARRSARKAGETAAAGTRLAREKLGEERIRLEARREAHDLRRKEEAMERDLRNREAVMPGLSSSVFDLSASQKKTMPDPAGFRFDDTERSVSLKNESGLTEPEEQDLPVQTAAEEPVRDFTDTEPDYNVDDVPFTETADERYRAYGKMLNGDKIDLKAAEKMGFAVSRDSVARTAEKNALREPALISDSDRGFLDSRYDGTEEDHLHRPLDPDEIIYPQDAEAGAQFNEYRNNDHKPIPEENPDFEPVKEDIPVSETETMSASGSGNEIPGIKTGYDELFHITDEQRDNTYNEREKAAKKESVPEPFGQETSAAAAPRRLSKPVPKRPYQFPPVSLLKKGVRAAGSDQNQNRENARKLEQVLSEFGVGVTVTNVVRGPRVTRYEMTPDVGVKVSRITSLSGDIKLALAASELRIEAPIPGKSAVGIEVPNNESATVTFRDIMETEEFRGPKSKLTWGVGLDIQGAPIVGDIAKMPHLLVSGTTGSGKSVGINSIIMSVIYRAKPEEVKMILIDPKVVELSVYDGIPHLLAPVVTKPEQALAVLNKACAEMQHRYNLFKESNTRNIVGYNEKVEDICRTLPEDAEKPEKLPYILIIIDELSELMMHSKRDVESAIVSLTQLARAAGIHLVVATQRPSVDVVTGLIKSNIPSRVAYRLPSGIDSRTILDSYGAETLLGNGDMLYKPGNLNSPIRVQGAYLSDGEVEEVVEWLKKHNSALYDGDWENLKAVQPQGTENTQNGEEETDDGRDEYFIEAGLLITDKKKASIGLLQRKFKIGFNRASRIMEQLNEAGVVSEGEGTKERQILMTAEEFRERF